jgi:hypothetical protein
MAWAEDTALQRCTRSAVPRAKTEARGVSRPPGVLTFGIGTKASILRGTMPRLLDRMSPLSSHQRRPNEIPVSAEPTHCETLLNADAHELALTLEQIRAWEPPASTKGGRRKAKRWANQLST